MKHIPIKLGPLAILLAVISICMTVLGILSFTTARADLSLAKRYGDTVSRRYELEAEGQAFLGEVHRALEESGENQKDLTSLEGVEIGEDGVIRKVMTKDSFTLTVGILPDEKEGIRIVDWSMERSWEPNEDIGNLWPGE